MKYNLSFLILIYIFLGLVLSLEDRNSLPFKLAQASGILYEKKINQDIMLVVRGKR